MSSCCVCVYARCSNLNKHALLHRIYQDSWFVITFCCLLFSLSMFMYIVYGTSSIHVTSFILRVLSYSFSVVAAGFFFLVTMNAIFQIIKLNRLFRILIDFHFVICRKWFWYWMECYKMNVRPTQCHCLCNIRSTEIMQINWYRYQQKRYSYFFNQLSAYIIMSNKIECSNAVKWNVFALPISFRTKNLDRSIRSFICWPKGNGGCCISWQKCQYHRIGRCHHLYYSCS